jgi:hypothetical protein
MPVGTGLNQVPTQIREVTSLAASGAGSLAEALSTPLNGAGCVIDFDVAGNINRIGMADLVIDQPGVQVRGETAPGEGINLVGCGVRVKRSGVVLSHFRIVPGDKPGLPGADNRDSLGIEGESQPVEDIAIRGMTFAYAVDGLVDLWSTTVKRVTIEDCIFAEALHASIHPEGAHSTALLLGQAAKDVLVSRNLFVSSAYRMPAICGGVTGAFVNNFIYNTKNKNWEFYTSTSAALFDLIGNVVQVGPSSPYTRTSPTGKFEVVQSGVHSGSRCYKTDNLTTVHPDLVAQDARFGQFNAFPDSTPGLTALGFALYSASANVTLPMTPMAASAVKAYVLANAGPKDANGALRNSVLETRIRAEALDGKTGSFKNTVPAAEAAYFGFPSQPPLTYGGIDDTAILAAIKAAAEARYPNNQTTDTTLTPDVTYSVLTPLVTSLQGIGAGQPLSNVDAVRDIAISIAAEAEALVESIDRQRANNGKPSWQG